MSMTDLRFVAMHTGGQLVGENVSFDRIVTDSRTVQDGDLFVALSGPNFDGHDFVADAVSKGAVAAMVGQQMEGAIPTVVVDDTLKALGDLATGWRGQFFLPVIGITGSTGKTTVKQMVASILRERGEVLATEGNLNNEIGVPLTLLMLGGEHRFAVIEMGANHVGEIARLASIARPDIGVVTNAGEAHLEGFGGIEGVVEGKGEMYSGVVDGGVCVINADQPWSEDWKIRAGARRKVLFGMNPGNDFHVRGLVAENEDGLAFEMVTPLGEIGVTVPLQGRHNAANALAAAAAAWAAGADLDSIRDGLAKVANVGGRMRVRKLANGTVIVDDTYNANPVSMRAAIDWLANQGRRGWLVLGDMGELGADAESLHEQVGDYARYRGLERLYCVGGLAAEACKAFDDARHFDSVDELIDVLRQEMEPGVTVLIKGSRAARMERVVNVLVEQGDG